MKKFVVFALLAVAVFGADEKKEEPKAVEDPDAPKTFKRLIPADVLRGMFFIYFSFLIRVINLQFVIKIQCHKRKFLHMSGFCNFLLGRVKWSCFWYRTREFRHKRDLEKNPLSLEHSSFVSLLIIVNATRVFT